MADLDLTLIWAGLLGFAIFAYVVMDGFDLGVGILFPKFVAGEERDRSMNSIAPVWDGNETWLILGGGGLMAAFPLAYAVLMPAVYMPVIFMLLGLVFRGVAFEFRWRTERGRPFWDAAFCGGSVVAALCQGIILGAVLQGVKVEGRGYGGGWWDWLTPFSLLTGLSTLVGYALLGATWLNMKTEGGIQEKARKFALPLALATVAAIVAVSAWTPFLSGGYAQRWFAWPGVLFTAAVPLLVAAVTLLLILSIMAARDAAPFLLSLALFGLTFLGLGISVFPYAVPVSITLWEAAAPPASQAFMLVGAGLLIPVILGYTAFAYWIFRGKVDAEGYH